MTVVPLRLGRRALGLAVFVFLSGCALTPPASFDPPERSIELVQTPFFAQTEYHCGPAALAMLLAAERLAVTPDALAPLIYVPGRKGSFQAEMLSAARRYQQLPLQLAPDAAALFAALKAGKPVLVLQNLGLRAWPIWHYAVLVGFEPARQQFVLRSGTTQRLRMDAGRFLASWTLADRWALVLSWPQTIPGFAQPSSWLTAAAPFESLGQLQVAEQAYRAALQRWPDSSLAWQAMANVDYAQARPHEAEAALRRAVELDPSSVAARNNLASVLLERGCTRAARAQIDAIQAIPAPMQTAVQSTRAAIDAHAGAEAADCF